MVAERYGSEQNRDGERAEEQGQQGGQEAATDPETS